VSFDSTIRRRAGRVNRRVLREAVSCQNNIWIWLSARLAALRRAGPWRANSRPASLPTTAANTAAPVECFVDSFEACIPRLRFPLKHARPIRITNLPERLFVEERRRLKIIPEHPAREPPEAEFAALIRAAEFEHRQITAMRKELDQESEAQLDSQKIRPRQKHPLSFGLDYCKTAAKTRNIRRFASEWVHLNVRT
jgi:hypothetical protein